MLQDRLADIAIILYNVLHEKKNIKFGLFGDYAISVVLDEDSPRGADNISCIVSTTKDKLTKMLDGKEGFVALPQAREDHVIFLWSELPNRSNPIMVECFCEYLPSKKARSNLVMAPYLVHGEKHKGGPSFFLHPFFLFKDKVRLTATRARFHDSSDLRLLEKRYNLRFEHLHGFLDLAYTGQAIKNFPELDRLFARIGVDVDAALLASGSLDLEKVNPPGPFEVQLQLSDIRFT